MRVLITGGAGYLGAVLTSILLARGHEVTVIDSFMYGQQSLNHLCHLDELTIIRADAGQWVVRNAEKINDFDVFVPLAAIVGAQACEQDHSQAWEVNTYAVQALVANARKHQIIIYPCTNSGYGQGTIDSWCTEEDPITPISEYGKSKVAAEKAVLAHPKGVSLRFATLFGPSARMRLDLMVNDFVYRAVKYKTLVLFESHYRRNFLHVADAANAVIFVMNWMARRPYPNTTPKVIFNVGDSRLNMTKEDLCARIAAKLNSMCLSFSWVPVEGRDPDQRDYMVSNAKIEALGWHPELPSLEDGIEELVRCYQQFHTTGVNRNA